MDHEAYENQMIDGINRNCEERSQHAAALDNQTVANGSRSITKTDVKALGRGLKRMAIALLTAAIFTISVISFIGVARAPGYAAVLLFLLAVIEMVVAFVLLYAQGITHRMLVGSRGDQE